MKTSYKILRIDRLDDVHISSARVKFYEGQDVITKEKDFFTGELKDVTNYVLNTTLRDVTYTPVDFGVIKDNNELLVFLNKELMKDTGRTPIESQTILDKTKVK